MSVKVPTAKQETPRLNNCDPNVCSIQCDPNLRCLQHAFLILDSTSVWGSLSPNRRKDRSQPTWLTFTWICVRFRLNQHLRVSESGRIKECADFYCVSAQNRQQPWPQHSCRSSKWAFVYPELEMLLAPGCKRESRLTCMLSGIQSYDSIYFLLPILTAHRKIFSRGLKT